MPEQDVHHQEEIKSYRRPNLTNQLRGEFMKTIDTAVLAGYNAGIERNRLRTGIGVIEFERTKEILLMNLPEPPAVIYDIGGGYGEYAWWLSSYGYEVHLFDISKTNIKMSEELATEYPNVHLASAEICDARSIPRPNKSADAILLMGPLYSITEYEERIIAIKECYRLLKNDGLLFTAALTPYGGLLHRITVYRNFEDDKACELDNPDVISMFERALTDGCYINPERKNASGLGSSHLHTAKALKEELLYGGFKTESVHGVMGGAWLAPNLNELLENEETRKVLMKTVRMLDTHEEIIGLSGHMLAVSRKDIIMNLFLSKLTLDDEQEFIAFYKEFMEYGGAIYPGILTKFNGNYIEYLERIEKNSDPLSQPEWRISDDTYILKNKDGRIYGMSSLRHGLNDGLMARGGHIGYGIRPTERKKGFGTKQLQLLLPKCKELGIEKVLITCDKENIASANIIKNNGGIMENEIVDEDGTIIQRYWIDLSKGA